MATARQLRADFRGQDREALRSVMSCSSEVLCCGQKDVQSSLGLSLSQHSSSRFHELQIGKLQFGHRMSGSLDRRHVRRARRKVLAFGSVFNEAKQSSAKAPPCPASPDVLKDQLEALQDEALQVRNRYNNARARFMRLTEVAHQLRERAAIDLNRGNDDAARKTLTEKVKVIHAAELSKRRAKILEELSSKLDEAISAKETHYIGALSTPQREDPTVIVVAPKEEGSSSLDQDSDSERSTSSPRTAETSQICHEGTNSVDSAAAGTADSYGDSGQGVPVSAGVLLERETVSLLAELGYSTGRHGNDQDVDVEAGVPVRDSDISKLPLGAEESFRDYRDKNAQSFESLLADDTFQGNLLASGSNEGIVKRTSDVAYAQSPWDMSDVDEDDDLKSGLERDAEVAELNLKGLTEYDVSRDGTEGVGTPCHDVTGQSEIIDGREAYGNASFNDERRPLFERLISDVDHQVATIESRLKTEVSKSMDSNDIEVQLVRDLLEQVQSLRARISEAVISLAQKETK